jgi:hypothetical protein
MFLLLSACGGGDGGNPVVVTPPAQSLVGSYTATGYDRDGVPQPDPSSEMEIGATQIRVTGSTNPGDIFLINTMCIYGITSSLQGTFLTARSPGTATYYFFYSGSGLQLTTWCTINNVTTTVRWTKTSDSTTLH